MKEEEYRDALALNLLRAGSSKLSLKDISNWTSQFSATPQGDQLGQMVFALNTATGSTCLGQCVFGCQLIPWGICCYFNSVAASSACSAAGCTLCGFCLSGGGVFVALGSVGGCGATVFRRIT